MPHITIKMFPGKTEEQKQQLTAAIVQNFIDLFQYNEDALSVSIEDVPKSEWKEKVYQPEIIDNKEHLYKEPGYKM